VLAELNSSSVSRKIIMSKIREKAAGILGNFTAEQMAERCFIVNLNNFFLNYTLS
jgi:hypothetical protein